jgi:UDP-GlcNAc:undecaprenyl-phosphate GlcNAc-1-phosphate transferase
MLSVRRGLLDTPSRRKIHRSPKPRLGGLAILLALLFPLVLLLPLARETQGFLTGLVILAALGLLDDVRGLDAWTKLPVQLLSAWMLVVFGGLKVAYLDLPGTGFWVCPEWFSNLFTILCLVAIVNAINLLDGLDGLAAGACVLIFGSIATLGLLTHADQTVVLVAVTFLGAIVGFLRYNRHPATIFMGDTGSTILGFGLGYACLALVYHQPHVVSTWVPWGLLALPVFDTLWAFGRRLRQGRSPFTPDQLHVHHRLLRSGIPHPRVVWILYGLTFLLCLQTVLVGRGNGWAILPLTLVTLGLFYVLLHWLQQPAVHATRLRTAGGGKPAEGLETAPGNVST